MKRSFKALFTAILLIGLPLALFFGITHYKRELSRLPEKRMNFVTRDLTADRLTAWPRKGTATLICPAFILQFAGDSFAPATPDGVGGFIGGDYRVDGRYGGLFPPDSEPMIVGESNGITYSYLASTRTMTILYKKLRLQYKHHLHTLEVDGKIFSTANGPIFLRINKAGQAQQLPLTPALRALAKKSQTSITF